MIKRKRTWKHKVNDDLEGASQWDNAENMELRKRKWLWRRIGGWREPELKPCNDLDGATKWVNFELWARKMNNLEPRITFWWTNSGRRN